MFSLSPVESHMVIICLLLASFSAAALIAYFGKVVYLIQVNVPIMGARGVLYALICQELVKKPRKQTVRNIIHEDDYNCRVITADGERFFEYSVVKSDQFVGYEPFDDAVILAGGKMGDFDLKKDKGLNKELLKRLLPDSKVKSYTRRNGRIELFVVYLKEDCDEEIKNAINSFFEDEYEKEMYAISHASPIYHPV